MIRVTLRRGFAVPLVEKVQEERDEGFGKAGSRP